MRFFLTGSRHTIHPAVSRPLHNASSRRRATRHRQRPRLERLEPRQVFAGSAIDPLLVVTSLQPVMPSSSIESTAPAVLPPGGSGSHAAPPLPPSPPPSSGDTYRVEVIADGYDGVLRERESFRVRVSRTTAGYPAPAAVGIWADTNFNGLRDDGEISTDQVIRGPNGSVEVKFQALDDGPAPGNDTPSDVIPIEVMVNGTVIKRTGAEIYNVAPVLSQPLNLGLDGTTLSITGGVNDPGIAVGDLHQVWIRRAGSPDAETGFFHVTNGVIDQKIANFTLDHTADRALLDVSLWDDDSAAAFYAHGLQRVLINSDDDDRNRREDRTDNPWAGFIDDDIVPLYGPWYVNADLCRRPTGRVDLFYDPSVVRVWDGPEKRVLLVPYGGIPNAPPYVPRVEYQDWQRRNPRQTPYVEAVGSGVSDVYVVWSNPQSRNGLFDPSQRSELGGAVTTVFVEPRLMSAKVAFDDQGITRDAMVERELKDPFRAPWEAPQYIYVDSVYERPQWVDLNADGDTTDPDEWSNPVSFRRSKALDDKDPKKRDPRFVEGSTSFVVAGCDGDFTATGVPNDAFYTPVSNLVSTNNGPFASTSRLPDRIDHGQLDITWTLAFAPGDRLLAPRDIRYGVSSHTVYVTGDDAPLAYETPLVLGTVAARGLRPDTPAEREAITSRIWAEFSDHSVRRASDNVEMYLQLPGEATFPWRGQTHARPGFRHMLSHPSGQGRSLAWARLFQVTLGYQGVSANVYGIRASSPYEGFTRYAQEVQGRGSAPATDYRVSFMVKVTGLSGSADRIWDPAYGVLANSQLHWEFSQVKYWWRSILGNRLYEPRLRLQQGTWFRVSPGSEELFEKPEESEAMKDSRDR
jgi:hypothetical protein